MSEAAKSGSKRIGLSDTAALPLYILFALTGVGTALLGATLPAMLIYWHLSDASAGGLFLVLFLASSLGSLLPRPNATAMAAAASAVIGLACVAMAVTHGGAVFASATLFGLGLGFGISTVTRVRLLCLPAERLQEVNRLNLVWGLGAFLCPAGANLILRRAGVRELFLLTGVVSGLVALWTALAALHGPFREADLPSLEPRSQQRLPWQAAAAAFLVVGLESALGAWLATYAHRLRVGLAAPVEATTLFWLGLLASRALCSTRSVRPFTPRQLLLGFIGLTVAGCAVLASSARAEIVLLASGLLGFGAGPVFPMLLAAVLPRVRGNLIFVIAGVGASVLPWLTGALSSRFGSLRLGLLAPVLAGAALLAIAPGLTAAFEKLNHETLEEDIPATGRV